MEILVNLTWVIAGFVGLVIGADLLVRGASAIARSLGVPPLVVGLTIVAYGTSMPEFMASFMAMRQGITGIALGNVLGSNICNIGLVLGVAGILTPIRMEKDVYRLQLPITLILTAAMAGMIWSGNGINRFEGILLFIGLIVYTYWNFKRKRDGMTMSTRSGAPNIFETHRIWAVGAMVAGCVLLFFGGNWVVNGATSIAAIFHVPDRIIGGTLVALGTSLPELITTVVGIWREETDLGVGNAIGSCIFNILMVIGGTAVYRPIAATLLEYRLEFIFCAVVLAILYPMAWKTCLITRTHGIILTAIYIAFIVFIY